MPPIAPRESHAASVLPVVWAPGRRAAARGAQKGAARLPDEPYPEGPATGRLRRASPGTLREHRHGPTADPVGDLLRQTRHVALLSAEKERDLAHRVRDHRDATAERTLIEANTRLVVSIARRYSAGAAMPRQDPVPEGVLGLALAVQRLDPCRGIRFSTYATWWVRQAITCAVSEQSRFVRLPVHAGDQRRNHMGSQDDLARGRRRGPTDEGLAEATGLLVDRVAALLSVAREPVSIDAPVSDESSTTLGETLPAEDERTHEAVVHECLADALRGELARLSERERLVVAMRYGLKGAGAHRREEVGALQAVPRAERRADRLERVRRLPLQLETAIERVQAQASAALRDAGPEASDH